jgi:hypothetical protein
MRDRMLYIAYGPHAMTCALHLSPLLYGERVAHLGV